MHVRRGMRGVTGNLYVGLDEFSDMALALHFLRPGDLFVDVGANVGAYTILAAGAIGARVIAFEPAPHARHWLAMNVELNDCRRLVDIRDTAVGSSCGTAAFTVDLDTTNHFVQELIGDSAIESATVRLTSLDAAIVGDHPVMLKVDVEGFEHEVVKGASATLADPALKCVLLELAGSGEKYGYDEGDIYLTMKSAGFELCSYRPRERMLTACGMKQEGANSLFVRDMHFVQDRVQSAAPFRVLNRTI